MALQKTFNTAYAVDANYVKISDYTVDRNNDRIVIKHPVWKDQASSANSSQPLENLTTVLDSSSFSTDDQATLDAFITLLYNQIKSSNLELTDAADV